MNKSMTRANFLKAAGTTVAGMAVTSNMAFADAAKNNDETWDAEVDFLVVGSGTAAMGALAASEVEGASIMIMEKNGSAFGGTSRTSGAGFWIPCNSYQAAEGIEDSRDAAVIYITQATEGHNLNVPLIEAFVDNAAAWENWFVGRTGIEFKVGGAQDYYDCYEGFLPRGRNSKQTDGNAALIWDTVQEQLEAAGVQIEFDCALRELVTDASGAVIGVEAERGGEPFRVKAGAVLLGTGGFDHNPDMVLDNLQHPVYCTNACTSNTGDGHIAAAKVGAKLALMDAYWQTPFFYPGEPSAFAPEAGVIEFCPTSCDWNGRRGKPNSIVVNAYGKRFGDETCSYAPFGRSWSEFNTDKLEYCNNKAFFICDSDFMKSGTLPGMSDDNPEPNEWFIKANTLEELAEALGIDVDGLLNEVERFNRFAETGVDEDFHRGEKQSSYQIFGKAVDRPDLVNNLIGPIATPPFYGALYLAGTCGTSGGVKINENSQVIGIDGEVIEGLYACGNCTAALSGPGYLGGGATLAPGCVEAYIAARHYFDIE